MDSSSNLKNAFDAFDEYNSKDPQKEEWNGTLYPKEVLYAERMTARLNNYFHEAPDHLQLAARCQHIGRWEIPRSSYPMDRKGYLQWRNVLKFHHAEIAEQILTECGYSQEIINKVKFLVLKKELTVNEETQILEDVICLVFIEFYLEAFANQHEDEKVVDIIRKTLKKISKKGITEAGKIKVSERIGRLISLAVS
jgi:hypothetical protein